MKSCCSNVMNQVKEIFAKDTPKDNQNVTNQQSTKETMDTKGAYLVFDTASSGSLFLIWKTDKIPKALAFIKPTKPVPEFKYTTNNGKTEIIRNLQSDKKLFYLGICQFVKEAKDLKADVTFLPSIQTTSPLKFEVYYLKANTVTQVKIGSSFSPADTEAVCVLPDGSSALRVKTMKKDLFVNRGNTEGASIAF